MLTLRELAAAGGCSASRVRYYLSLGLLSHRRGARGEYLFDDSGLRQLQLIDALQGHELSLDQIAELLDPGRGPEACRSARGCVEGHRGRLADLDLLINEAARLHGRGT